MSFACPRGHQSYASFRIEVFSSLFCPLAVHPTLSYGSCPRHVNPVRRSFRSSTKVGKQRGSRNTERHGTQEAKRDTPAVDNVGVEQRTSTDGEVQRASDGAGTQKPWKWTPYSAKGRDDLKALVSDLKTAASDFEAYEKEYQNAPTKGVKVLKYIDRKTLFSEDSTVASARRISLDLPESPLMRRLRKEKVHKREPTDEELKVLSQNPWAALLSSPVRQCQGTGVRLPRDLMVPWGLVERPADGNTYVVPHELADLKRLKNPDTAVWRPAKGTATDEEIRHSSPRSLDDSSGRFKRTSAINIIPHRPLVELLTSRMIRSKAGQPITKKGAVQRILPQRLRTSLLAEKHYAREGDKIIDLPSLQWQPDIAERMLDIIRQRVLNALTALGSSSPQRGTIDPVPLGVLETGSMVAVYDSADGQKWLRYRFEVGSRPRVADPVIIDNFAGSFLIHINGGRTVIPHQPTASLASGARVLPQTISLNNTIRLPVFNLLDMMGEENESLRRYEEALRSSEVLGPPKPMEWEARPLTQDRGPGLAPSYLLFVSAKAPKARSLVMELWQLWRYKGGEMEALEAE